MKRAIFYILTFVGGGIAGGAVSYLCTKRHLDAMHAEEIAEMREYYENIISSGTVEEIIPFEEAPKTDTEKEHTVKGTASDTDEKPTKAPLTDYTAMYKKKPKSTEEHPSEKPYLSEPQKDSLLISAAQYNNSDYDKLIMDWYKGNTYLDVRDWGIAGQLQSDALTDAYYEIKEEVETVVTRAIRDGTIQKTIYIRNSKRSEEYKVTIYDTSYEE